MSKLDIVTLTLSLILGLSIAQMVGAVAAAIRGQRQHLDWIPMTWAAAIFLLHVQFWFAIVDIGTLTTEWSWDWYAPVLLTAVLLFLSGALVLPSRDHEWTLGMKADFECNGRFALIPFTLYMLVWMPVNARMSDNWFDPANILNSVLAGLAALAFAQRTLRYRGIATAAYLVLVVFGMLFVWSRPGSSLSGDRPPLCTA